MLRDLRQAVRMLLKTKGWTAVVLLSLALGIGANTALFSGINALLLRTLPVSGPDALVRVRWAGTNEMRRSTSDYGFAGKNAAGEDVRSTFSYPIYQAMRAANQSLSDMLACAPIDSLNVVVDGKAELARALIVSGSYFRMLGISAEIGRIITPEDDRESADLVAVISHGFWARRFGLDRNIAGKAVTMNNNPVTIIGVIPAEFTGVLGPGGNSPTEIIVPLASDRQFGGNQRLSECTTWWLTVMGRLKPGVTPQQVRGNLEGPFQQAAREGWAAYFASIAPEQRALSRNQSRTAVPHLEVDSGSRGIYDTDGNTRRSAAILTIVVALVMLIVCANVANLLLSRAMTRQREIAARMYMGATRWRLVRQLLAESLLLSSIGGGLGVLAAYWGRQLLPFRVEAPLDWRVFGFVALLCVLSGVAFGIVPALRATGAGVAGLLKENSRNITRSQTLLGKSLLVAQVAISLALLVGAGLFLRTLQNLRGVDVGFDTRNLVLFRVDPRPNGYDASRVAVLFEQIHDAVRAIPGVRSASFSQNALLSGSRSTSEMFIQGRPPAGRQGLEIYMMTVSPAFFETLEVPLLRGRGLAVQDTLPKAPQVAIINDAAARQYFPGEDPMGRRFGFSLEDSGKVEIVGVLKDTKYSSLRDAAPPTVYQPFLRESVRPAWFHVRTMGDPAQTIQAVRGAVQKVDPNLPLAQVTTQAEQIEGRFAQERLFAVAYSLFGALALLLACIGLFGVMSYGVAQRTNEIGIRMAMGAERRSVVGMVLRESMIMVGLGIALGIAVSVAAGRLMAALLFGLAPTDTWTIVLATAIMGFAATIAGYLPARRASRVDPVVALHHD